jgi:hypothetical protein
MSNNTSKSTRNSLARSMIGGISKDLTTTKSFVYQGVTYVIATGVPALQAMIDAGDATTAAKAKLHDAVLAEKSAVEAATPFMKALKGWLLATYADATFLADFGLVPHKPRTKLTAEAQLTRVQKNLATRKARNTQGKKQKKSVHGAAVTPPAGGSPPAKTGS